MKVRRGLSAVLFFALGWVLLGAAAQETALPVPAETQESGEAAGSPQCAEPYTPTGCSVENEKYVRSFDWLAAVLLPGIVVLALPIAAAVLRPSKMGWWRTGSVGRWVRFSVPGFAFAFILFWLLPLLGRRGTLPASVAFLGFPGLRLDFPSACEPCSAQVSNYPPLFGFLGNFGMPEMGLALEHPFQFLGALLASFAFFSLLYLTIHLLWRGRAGFASRCQQ